MRAASESGAADKRLEQLRDEQRERERAVYTLRSRIDTLAQTAPEKVEVGEQFQPLAEFITTKYETAVAAALGAFAEAQAGEISAQLIADLEKGTRSALIDVSVAAPSSSWRVDATLPAGTSWLLDHIAVVPEVSAALHRLLADVVLVSDVAEAKKLVAEDPRLRAVTESGVVLGEGWVAVSYTHLTLPTKRIV